MAPVNHVRVNNAAWSPELQATVMVLANYCFSSRIETWTWDGEHFTRLAAEYELHPWVNLKYDEDPIELVLDQAYNRLLLFETLGRIHVLEDGTWNEIWSKDTTRFGFGFSAEYFPDHQSIIIFGGSTKNSKTWEFRDDTLTKLTTVQSPPPSYYHSLVYDRVEHVLVLFGGVGEGGICLNETWEFDGQDWRSYDFTIVPGFRQGMVMDFDQVTGSVVMTGGSCGLEMFHDVWRYLDHTWVQDELVGIKPKRTLAACAYDPNRQCLVICGGRTGEITRGSLLELSYTDSNQH